MPYKFDPAHRSELDRPDRAEWQPAASLLQILPSRPDAAYADIGCGTGYFSLPLAQRLLPDGKVYGLDTEPAMLEELRRRARERNLANVIALRTEESRIPLPAGAILAAISTNTFHEFEAPLALLYEAFRILEPSGRLILADWKPVETPMGPPLEERVPVERVREGLRAAGFVGIREHAIYRYHYVIEGSKRGGKR